MYFGALNLIISCPTLCQLKTTCLLLQRMTHPFKGSSLLPDRHTRYPWLTRSPAFMRVYFTPFKPNILGPQTPLNVTYITYFYNHFVWRREGHASYLWKVIVCKAVWWLYWISTSLKQNRYWSHKTGVSWSCLSLSLRRYFEI